MRGRLQRTIGQNVELSGIGFLTGRDIAIRFLPAPAGHGIAFCRVDCPGRPVIPARIEFAVPRQRRTAVEAHGVAVEMTEHVLAALAGLQIDNCVVELDGPEPPGFDGSALAMAQALLAAGSVEQPVPRPVLTVAGTVVVTEAADDSEITCRPLGRPGLAIGYHLDYGLRSPIPAQQLTIEICPETFLRELASARTFVLEREVAALRAQGYGARTTARDILVIGERGPVDNSYRSADECSRHKILDCLGDFALLGCDVHGHFTAYRSGHRLNREMVRKLLSRASQSGPRPADRAA